MKKYFFLLLCVVGFQLANSQNRVILTGVSFLTIPADARASGIGNSGVATSSDVFSQQHNSAKYAFSLQKHGVSLSYTSYLASITNDVSLGQFTYYNKINERSAFGSSLRYFGLGEIELRDTFEGPSIIIKPNEIAFDLSYSLKLSDRFSMAVAGRYIRSSLRIPDSNNDPSAANGFAVDIAGFYQSQEIAYNEFNGLWRAGFNIQNLGPKISYDSGTNDFNSNFLPTNLKVGGGFDFIFDDYNKLAVSLEFNKLLVPTPQDSNLNRDLSLEEQNNERYRSIGWVSGIFRSFGDAPDGFKEELKEITYGIGAEYWYQNSFAFRIGYFNESLEKGGRKYFTMGTGLRYNIVKIDVSYLLSTSKLQNPLENTLRFSLSFSFGDNYSG